MSHILHSLRVDTFPESQLKALKGVCGLRRADRFTTMALYAVQQAFPETFPRCLPADAALVTSSPLGPANTTFALLDNILDFPEDQIQPTRFSHSVHNAAISYMTAVLGVNGPSFALTNNRNCHSSAVVVADSLLMAHLCPQVLIVEINEDTPVTQLLEAAAPQLYPARPQETADITLLEY